MRYYILSEDVAEEIDRWALHENEGGWQRLCKRIKDGEHRPFDLDSRSAQA